MMNTDIKEIKKELRRDANINALLLLAFWLIYFAVAAAVPHIAGLISDKNDADFSSLSTMFFYFLLYPIGFPIIFLIFRAISKNHKDLRLKTCFCKPQMPAGWVVKWIFLTIGATYASAYISNFLFIFIEWVFKIKLTEAQMTNDTSAITLITNIIAIPIFAPVLEELFFRGTMFRNVEKYGPWSMIIISGITFGLWHANYSQLIFAASMGVFSCFLIAKTKSVIPSMIVHFCINSIGCLTLILTSGLDLELLKSGDTSQLLEHPLILITMFAMGMMIIAFLITWLVFMIIEITCHRESFHLENSCPELSGGQKLLTYLSAPLMAVMMLAMTVMTVYRALGGVF